MKEKQLPNLTQGENCLSMLLKYHSIILSSCSFIIFICLGYWDAEAETTIFWPPDAKN